MPTRRSPPASRRRPIRGPRASRSPPRAHPSVRSTSPRTRRGGRPRSRRARPPDLGGSAILGAMVPPARHLLRARDLADARYFEPLTVSDMAGVAGLSSAHFSREFRRTFGESPHRYLLTRRLERAAALLRNTDRSVTEICFAVGLASVGSFTTSFRRVYGTTPSAYRAMFPPAQRHI